MKKILKRILLFVCILSLGMTSMGCEKDNKDGTNKPASKPQENVSDWELPIGDSTEDKAENQFGDEKDNNVIDLNDSNAEDGSDEVGYPDYKEIYGDTALLNTNELQFFYKGLSYAYGITQEGKEVIALIDQNSGDWIDILNGAGTIQLNTSSLSGGVGTALLESNGIESFDQTMVDGFTTLYITYKLTGYNVEGSELVSTYTFKERAINVTQSVRYTDKTLSVVGSKSYIVRRLMQEKISTKATPVGRWVYPENGDYPYQECESIGTEIKFDEHHTLYTFMHPSSGNYTVTGYPEINLPLDFEETKGVNYSCSFDIVPYTNTDNETEDRYRALFAGRGSNYAVGVFPTTNNTENSTVFVGNSVDLNLNFTNIIDTDVLFSLRYDIRDYYGNIVDAGVFVNNTALPGTSVNHKIHVEGKYGMYYLNLYTISGYYAHLECYPFALIRDYDYKYRSTNPFGMTSMELMLDKDPDGIWIPAKLFVKMGVGTYRLSNMNPVGLEAARYMQENGIQINPQTGTINTDSGYMNKIDSFKTTIADFVNKTIPDIGDSLEVGNEVDGAITIWGKPLSSIKDNYVNGTHIPASQVLRSMGRKYVCAGLAGAGTVWLDVLGETWDLMDVLSAHPYGYPSMPDAVGGATDNTTWNIEQGMQRCANAIKKYGNKELWFSEIGYPTPPLVSDHTSLRTVADYDMRTYVLGSYYGATRIELYSTYDVAAGVYGFVGDNVEMNFGKFYNPDWLGTVKPKPSAAAIAAINFVTDGLQKTEEAQKYTTSTIRTFKMTIKGSEDVYCTWSNTKPLPNGSGKHVSDRIVGMPWENEWDYTDYVTYDAVGSKVTVYDVMGNATVYTAEGGKVTIPVTGSPIYIKGIK